MSKKYIYQLYREEYDWIVNTEKMPGVTNFYEGDAIPEIDDVMVFTAKGKYPIMADVLWIGENESSRWWLLEDPKGMPHKYASREKTKGIYFMKADFRRIEADGEKYSKDYFFTIVLKVRHQFKLLYIKPSSQGLSTERLISKMFEDIFSISSLGKDKKICHALFDWYWKRLIPKFLSNDEYEIVVKYNKTFKIINRIVFLKEGKIFSEYDNPFPDENSWDD